MNTGMDLFLKAKCCKGYINVVMERSGTGVSDKNAYKSLVKYFAFASAIEVFLVTNLVFT